MSGQSKDHGWQARILWQQQGTDYQLRLMLPLGQGAIRITKNAQGVSIRTAQGRRYQAADAEQLLTQKLGLTLPVKALQSWIRGIADPDTSITLQQWDTDHLLRQLQQAGWQIDYQTYKSFVIKGKPYQLPTRLSLRHADYFAKIAVSRWAD